MYFYVVTCIIFSSISYNFGLSFKQVCVEVNDLIMESRIPGYSFAWPYVIIFSN